jgi:hypothetical protein
VRDDSAPDNEVAATRVAKRGEYQPPIGPTLARRQVHSRSAGKCERALPGVRADLPGKRCVGSV